MRVNWTDASGRALSDYPRPSLAVDVVLLVVENGSLAVLLHERENGPALPGTFVREGERLAGAVDRAVVGKVGQRPRRPAQLDVFDDPSRDDRGHVVSVAHVDLLDGDELLPGAWRLASVEGDQVVLPDGQERLPFDHELIVATAVRWARERYARRPDPLELLGEAFTLRDLQRLHEAVLGEELVKDTFRRGMTEHLERTQEQVVGRTGRPARLYRRRAQPLTLPPLGARRQGRDAAPA